MQQSSVQTSFVFDCLGSCRTRTVQTRATRKAVEAGFAPFKLVKCSQLSGRLTLSGLLNALDIPTSRAAASSLRVYNIIQSNICMYMYVCTCIYIYTYLSISIAIIL